MAYKQILGDASNKHLRYHMKMGKKLQVRTELMYIFEMFTQTFLSWDFDVPYFELFVMSSSSSIDKIE